MAQAERAIVGQQNVQFQCNCLQQPIPFRPSQQAIDEFRRRKLPEPADHANIKQSILEADAEIDHLTERLNTLKKFSAQQKCRLAPVRRLPLEILRIIFLEVCGSTRANRLSSPNGHLAALSISHTCSIWRVVSHSYAAMWTHMFFDLPEEYTIYGTHPSKYPTELFNHYVTHCGPSFLHVEIYASGRSQLEELGFSREAQLWLKLVLNTSDRWASLTLDGSAIDVLAEPIIQAKCSFSSLTSLTFPERGWTIDCDEFDTVLGQIILSSARLQHLERNDLFPDDSILRSTQLKSFSAPMFPVDISRPAGCSDSLEELEVMYLHNDRVGGSLKDPIVFSKLRTLRLADTSPDGQNLFYRMTLPVLEVLMMDNDQMSCHWSQLDFRAMYARAPFHLRVLTLSFTDISEESLIEILDLMSSSLTHLSVFVPLKDDFSEDYDDSEDGDEYDQGGLSIAFIQKFALTVEPSSSSTSPFAFVPLLQHLEVYGELPWDSSCDHKLLDLLELRAHNIPSSSYPHIPKEYRHLRTVSLPVSRGYFGSLKGEDRLEAPFRNRVDSLKSSGLDIEWGPYS